MNEEITWELITCEDPWLYNPDAPQTKLTIRTDILEQVLCCLNPDRIQEFLLGDNGYPPTYQQLHSKGWTDDHILKGLFIQTPAKINTYGFGSFFSAMKEGSDSAWLKKEVEERAGYPIGFKKIVSFQPLTDEDKRVVSGKEVDEDDD